MTQYSFILLSGEQEAFMEKLRTLGVMDVTRSAKPVDETSSSMFAKSDECKKVLGKLENVDYSKDADLDAINTVAADQTKVSFGQDDPLKAFTETSQRLEELGQRLQMLRKEYEEQLPWGTFDEKKIKALAEQGYKTRFYKVQSKIFDEEWADSYPLQVISENGPFTWFVTVSDDPHYDFPIDECNLPSGSFKDTAVKMDKVSVEIVECKGKLLSLKRLIPQIEKGYNEGLSSLQMYLANVCCEKAAEDQISVITGFAPTEDEKRLTEALDKEDVFYMKSSASFDDNPPIKLKSNKYTNMFSVLTKMYGLPVYNEFDPTPFLSIFFLLFFAMCLGDAGYGIILIFLGFALKKVKGIGSIAPLVSTLGVATLIVGTILHTFFGMDTSTATWMPDAIKKCMITGKIAGYDAQMVSAVIIGIVHLCLAITLKTIYSIKQNGFLNALGDVGWCLAIVGGVIVGGISLTGVMSSSVTKIVIITLGSVSALGIFILNDLHRNPFANIGIGVWNTYNTATGLLGDTLSYLRLYALGLAGGMLGNAFNALASSMIQGDHASIAGWIGFVLILIFGHTLNIAMSCLGAFVHPLRLNFLEFFKNSAYVGQGREYKPLQ